MPDPRDPLTEAEKQMFGHDAVRDPVTGYVFEQGEHALPRAEQAAQFLRQARLADDMPKEGERCAQTGREFECGSGAHPKTVQTRLFQSQLPPQQQASRKAAFDALVAAEPAGKA
jgi:hypothetical protein